MQRAITDLWQNLVRYPGRDENAVAEQSDENESSDDRAESIQETYKNLYWIRLVSLQNHEAAGIDWWPIADDIIEILDEIDELEDVAVQES